MQNNIKEDLQLFNELVEEFLKQETDVPVSGFISPEDLLLKVLV